MSLLDGFARTCVLLVQTEEPDGAGGWNAAWAEGPAFSISLAMDSSLEARRAEREGVTSVYTALVDRSVPIQYGGYFRDESTGRTYRVTSDPAEKTAPACATLPLKAFTAERREPPA